MAKRNCSLKTKTLKSKKIQTPLPIVNNSTNTIYSSQIKPICDDRYFSNNNSIDRYDLNNQSNRYISNNSRCFSNDNMKTCDSKRGDRYSPNDKSTNDRYDLKSCDRYFSNDNTTDEDDLDDSKPVQRNAANARERARMRILSKAFYRLKTTLPWVGNRYVLT
uniref:Transcription factor 21 n=1 Tax=Cacopsylla melanoneura TaxID=428564 RepID=A0A8D8TE25_9HEMI